MELHKAKYGDILRTCENCKRKTRNMCKDFNCTIDTHECLGHILDIHNIEENECMCNEKNHKLVHLKTKKYQKSMGFNTDYTRIDTYHCEKCGEIITKKTTKCQRDRPEWY